MSTIQVQQRAKKEDEVSGDEELRRRFGTPDVQAGDIITESLARQLESFEFFFIATSNRRGECDSSFRGRRGGAPAVKVLDSKTLVFPDYLGNGSFRSLGNILENPHIGMLFMDFDTGLRMRVNGEAEVTEDPNLLAMFRGSIQIVRVKVREVYKQNRPVSISASRGPSCGLSA